MDGQALRIAAESLRVKYARRFRVPIDLVEVVYFRDDEEREDARIQSPGNPEWTVGK